MHRTAQCVRIQFRHHDVRILPVPRNDTYGTPDAWKPAQQRVEHTYDTLNVLKVNLDATVLPRREIAA